MWARDVLRPAGPGTSGYGGKVAMVTSPSASWIGKLDDALREQFEAPAAADPVACLVYLDEPEWSDVEGVIVDSGGVVFHRVVSGPALVVELPVGALGAVAASDSVVRIDTDDEYVATW